MTTIWKPHPGPQEAVLRRIEYEILFGGSRGPGKTDAGLVWMTDHIDNPRFRGLVIRKNADDLSDWIDRAHRMYARYGVKIAYRPAILTFPSGAIIKTGHLKDDQAYTKYQGHEYQCVLIEELTQIPDEKRYLQLIASCRSTLEGVKAQIFCTTNPGGVGHGWVKKRFVDPSPPGVPFKDPVSGRTRIFIPATVDDNPTLMEADPDYIRSLDALKEVDEDLYKAWRLGDWDTFAGQYFKEFRRDLHVTKRFTPKAGLFTIAGLDWGRADPFACMLTIVYRVDNIDEDDRAYHFYRAITYDEIYGTDKRPEEWGQIIASHVNLDRVEWFQCDNQIFNTGNDNSMSIFEQFCKYDERFRGKMKAASKERIGGWENLHNWLSIAPDGRPYWMITDNCVNLIRTLPGLVHEELPGNVEDVDTTGEDHAPDAIRYMFKGLKWMGVQVGAVQFQGDNKHTIKPKNKLPVMELDLDAFADAKESTRSWQEI